MDSKKSRSVNEKDAKLEKAYEKYMFLKQEVDNWQKERGSHWLNLLKLAEAPPYLPVQDLPSQAVIELWQRLNCSAGVEVSDTGLEQIWQRFRESRNISELTDEEMSTRFQMAVRGVAHLAGQMAAEKGIIGEGFKHPEYPHSSVVCPVCGEVASLAVVTPPNGKRIIHCSSCGFEWKVKRIICLHCGSEDAKKQVYLKHQAFPGIEMAVCQLCGHYFKEIDSRELAVTDYIWEDLKSLPLNYASERWLAEQAEKENRVH